MKKPSIILVASLYFFIIFAMLYAISYIEVIRKNVAYLSFIVDMAMFFLMTNFLIIFCEYNGYSIKSILGVDDTKIKEIEKKYKKAINDEDYLLANKYHKLLVQKTNLKKLFND